jgi:hypothetical protein
MELVALVIAIYGALLSTVLGISEFVRTTRRLEVSCDVCVLGPPSGPWEAIEIQAVNKRPRPVTISSTGFKMSDGSTYVQLVSFMGPLPLPKRLGHGEAVTLFFDRSEMARILSGKRSAGVVMTKAFVRDAEGKVYTAPLPKVLRSD